MLCQFLEYYIMNQLCVYIYMSPRPLDPPSHTAPVPSLQAITKRRAELPVLGSRSPLAIYFTQVSVYVSMLVSQFVQVSLSHALCEQNTSWFSMSVSLFLPCKSVHQCHFSRFHTYVLIYATCVSLSDSLCITGSGFTHLTRTDSNSSLFMVE